MTETCPTFGDFVTTAHANVRPPASATTHGQIMDQKSINIAQNASIFRIQSVIEEMQRQANVLIRNSPHPKGSFVVGVLHEAVAELSIVLVRTRGKQAQITDYQLEVAARSEAEISAATFEAMRPLAESIVRGNVSAEKALSSLRRDPNPSKAAKAVATMALRGLNMEIEGTDPLVIGGAGLDKIEMSAAKLYTLSLTAQKINLMDGYVQCRLRACKDDISDLFRPEDINTRDLDFNIKDEFFFLVAQAASLGVVFEANVAVRVNIDAKGAERFSGVLVSFNNLKQITADLKARAEEKYRTLSEFS